MSKKNKGLKVSEVELIFATELAFLEGEIAKGIDEGDGFLQAVVDHVKVKQKKLSFKQLSIVHKKMNAVDEDDETIRKQQQSKLEMILKSPKLDEASVEFMTSLYGQTATKKLSSKQEYYVIQYFDIHVGA